MELETCQCTPDSCQCLTVHCDVIEHVRKQMPPEETLYDLAELFKIFGDSTRVKILWALNCSEMCVCDIAELLGTTNSAVSHQLRVLKSAKLVKARKSGKEVYYSLSDDHVHQIFSQGLDHINE